MYITCTQFICIYYVYIYTHIFCRYRHVECMNLIYLYTYITPISYIRVIKTNIIPGKVMCFDLSWGDCRRRLVCQTMGVFTRSFKWSWNHQKNTPSKTNGWNLKSGALGKRKNIHTNHQHCWVTCFFLFGGVKKQQNVLLLSKRMQGFKDQNSFEWPQVETYTKVSLFLNLIEGYPPGN